MSFTWNFHLLDIVLKFIEFIVTNCNLKACFKILIYFCLRRNLEEVKQEVESCNNTSSNWFACYSHISARYLITYTDKMMDKNTLICFFGRHIIILLRNKTNTSVWRKVLLNVYNFSDCSLKMLDPITIASGIDMGFDKTWTLFLSTWNGLCYQIHSFYYIYVHCMTDCHEDIWKI